ncbi:hypothetical protein L345_18200 [Ophiophagus hannah]|uniref:Uncharacterized protein n=1 Tax=Ophiophagus hannah TaxID=8665 RepID=V8N1P8_OPHHA|nr:hypothetical protein L345_18200 [Ophiophagus hannah]
MRTTPPSWAMPASWGAPRRMLGNGPGWSAFRPAPTTSAGGASCTPGGCCLQLTASLTGDPLLL